MRRAVTERQTNLPAELSSFVGRRHELAQVRSALRSSRLVTLSGPGGVGKTRLALRAAADLAAAYPDGAWVVELAPVQDPELVPDTVVAALGLRDATHAAPLEGLLAHLHDRALLLVVDNCEHLQDAAAALITQVIGACPDVHVVATSRHALAVDGEHLLPVPPLPVPQAGRDAGSLEGLLSYDSVRLFAERATDSSPSFAVTDTNQQAVADLVRRLDGVPLAIELASVRVRSLSVHQILHRLDDRFRLLTRGDRAARPRQQTLRALVDWSHELLSPEERTLWARSTVFSGSFDLRDLTAVVVGEALPAERVGDLADGLVAKSILVRESGDGEPRYHMLESLKEYGLMKLAEAGETERLRRCHLEHYRTEVLSAARERFGPEGVTWFRRLSREHDDLRAAMEHCVSGAGPLEQGCTMLGRLQHHWVMTGRFSEGRRWADRLLAEQPGPGVGRAAALVTGGRLAVLLGDLEEGRSLLQRGLVEATAFESRTWRAHALHGLALAALFWQEPAEARTLLEEALDLHRGGDDPFGVPLALIQLATVHATLGQSDRAMAYAEECIALGEEAGEQWCTAMARWAQALVVWRQGRSTRVRSYAREVLRLKEPFGDRLGMAMSMEVVAWTACMDGRYDEAARLFGAVQSALSSVGGALFRPLRAEHDRCTELTRAAMGAAEFDRSLALGAGLTFEDAVALALGPGRATRRSAPSARGAARLTRREEEVARLVAAGLTDREIAQRLFMAQRTAEGHVQRALSKLGFTSRQQLAGWVDERAS